MKTLLFAIAFASTLSACGGGGTGPVIPNIAPAVQEAITVPVVKPYTVAWTALQGVSIGFVTGYDEYDTVAAAISPVVQNPGKYPDFYKAMLSDKGLPVTLYGEKTGTSNITGAAIYGPDRVYFVKLTNAGIVITKQ